MFLIYQPSHRDSGTPMYGKVDYVNIVKNAFSTMFSKCDEGGYL